MISFSVTLKGGFEHHADLTSEPPTTRDPALERDILTLVSKTLQCNVTGLTRQTNAKNKKFAYDKDYLDKFRIFNELH
jgi:hypothetical protein